MSCSIDGMLPLMPALGAFGAVRSVVLLDVMASIVRFADAAGVESVCEHIGRGTGLRITHGRGTIE